ncbi:MAG: hypothetical protein GF331_18830 [Chitinivibrionales bacterium]|nr:hypothetical protein [Chitinivibrionales bacterium]
MKVDLRKYLPPSREQLDRFERALHATEGGSPPEGPFKRLMGGVKAAARLDRFRDGTETPASLRVLIDTINEAYGIEEPDMVALLAVAKGIWRKALSGRVEPYRIAAEHYARLAREFGLHYTVIKGALLGSYRLFVQRNLDTHVRFARASTRSRRREGYSRELALAFEELRTKSATHRQALAGDGAMERFLEELEQCMG